MADLNGGMVGTNKSLADLNHIAEPLRGLAVPVADLHLDPANARRHGDRNVETIDVLPTIADLLGIEIPWARAGAIVCG